MKRNVIKKCFQALSLLLLLSLNLFSQGLYENKGISPWSVKQGNLGSCYFHATIASIAHRSPKYVEKLITVKDEDKVWSVKFADGKAENVYLEDVVYTRSKDYDKSDGLWVSILFRAYSQKILRKTLYSSLLKYSSNEYYTTAINQFLINSDAAINSFDRVVRNSIVQNKTFDRAKYNMYIETSLSAYNMPTDVKLIVLNFANHPTAIKSIEGMVQQYTGVFGASRLAGNGGMSSNVFDVFVGNSSFSSTSDRETALFLLNSIKSFSNTGTASTGNVPVEDLEVKKWYVERHAYTILDFDGENVTLRNPWGIHPDPDGSFTIDLDLFLKYFSGIYIGK
jgi:hypothetical protein